ncbi:Glutathione S-transferase [Prochlorococcus marinus str. MIT 9515]|uniref:Glutathione S-transferase n=1 Tax=Prochlorococcus marinus (strain MIT 9515) TaxID=167542 RepID=A2BVM8_PROM5|nr:glutathione S-transferase N-terminal domain-containing protein [Prochlorococcus marinus]ABM71839.1 Glutathione S-transferase [Prochlorococcus marinus str. MIT 9515]
MNKVLSWADLSKFEIDDIDRVNGINNSYSNLRLFGHSEKEVDLTLFRDRHSWCPYCQKIWLWLEFKRIPYKVKKINMYCYGQKEKWYLNKVSSGKLPAIDLNGEIITESDNIISLLENEYGTLGSSLLSNDIREARILEREIFRSWCNWLCRKSFSYLDESFSKNKFKESIQKFEKILSSSKTGFIDSQINDSDKIEPGTGDIIFIPYIERMNASLSYYKGFNLRNNYPHIDRWLSLLENLSPYRGTQGDFHTHSHDLPPQMGGCFKDVNDQQILLSNLIDVGEGLGKSEFNQAVDLDYYAKFALKRVLKHKDNIINANPYEKDLFDQSLRSALTYMITSEINKVPDKAVMSINYLKNRISVPRDMPVISARLLRQSLNKIGSPNVNSKTDKIPVTHRYDQDPSKFKLNQRS